jgi:ribosomal protein S18 acetylase RimI-like enzyme
MGERQVFGRIKVTAEAEIRPCGEDDLAALEWMGLFTPHRHIIREAFEAQQRGDALLLLAMARGFPIAQVWIDFARKRKQGIAVLWAIRTFYPLQRAGIGRRMVEAAERVLHEHGIRQAELEVDRDNSPALNFYRKLGWRRKGKVRPDRWLLAKTLPQP